MSFTAATQNSNIANGIAVGMNPYKDWDKLVQHLHATSKHIVAGDFTAFDGNELPQVHKAICVEVNRWYGGSDEESLVRTVLFKEVYSSKHLCGKGMSRTHVVQWNKSLPSGHPATSVLNSFYNLTLFVLVFNHVHKGVGLDFWEHISPVVYGDDNVAAVSQVALLRFNQQTMADTCKLFGQIYTPEDKKTVLTAPSRPITACTFLKRSFVHEEGRWMCPLELDSVIWRCYWHRGTLTETEALQQNLEGTLLELSMHPQSVWTQFVGTDNSPGIMLRSCASLEIPVLPTHRPDRALYQERVLNMDYDW